MTHKHKKAWVARLSVMALALTPLLTVSANPATAPIGKGTLEARPGKGLPGSAAKPAAPAQPARLDTTLGLAVIEDQLAGNLYITTVESGGMVVPGSPQQALYGVALPSRGARVAAWYTHKADPAVQKLDGFQPAEAFRGVADANGAAAALNGGMFSPIQGRQLNPVLSETALRQIQRAASGAAIDIGFKETLADGKTRDFHARVGKQGQLTLKAPLGQASRDDTVNGVAGKVYVLRQTAGQASGRHGGDIRFGVRARTGLQGAAFRVGKQWRKLGDSVGLAEFAEGRAIEVFIPANAVMDKSGRPPIEAGFYSASRQSRGDRFSLSLPGFATAGGGKDRILSRLSLLTIADAVSGGQYVTTLSGPADQAVFGMARPTADAKPAAWRLDIGERQPLFPLTKLTSVQPAKLIAGLSGPQGGLSNIGSAGEGQVYPVFTADAIAGLMQQAVGQQYTLVAEGQRRNGTVEYRSNLIKNAALTLSRPAGQLCQAATVDGVEGQLCSVRSIKAQHRSGTDGDIRFTLRSKTPLAGVRWKVGEGWRALNDSIGLQAFASAGSIDLFVPNSVSSKDAMAAIDGQFYSAARRQLGDSYTLNLSGGKTTLPTSDGQYSKKDFGLRNLIGNSAENGSSISFVSEVDGVPAAGGALHYRFSSPDEFGVDLEKDIDAGKAFVRSLATGKVYPLTFSANGASIPYGQSDNSGWEFVVPAKLSAVQKKLRLKTSLSANYAESHDATVTVRATGNMVTSVSDDEVTEGEQSIQHIKLFLPANGTDVLHLRVDTVEGTPPSVAQFPLGILLFEDGAQVGVSIDVNMIVGFDGPVKEIVVPKNTKKMQISFMTLFGEMPSSLTQGKYTLNAWLNKKVGPTAMGTVIIGKRPPAIASITEESVKEGKVAIQTLTTNAPLKGTERLHLAVNLLDGAPNTIADFDTVVLTYKDGAQAGKTVNLKLTPGVKGEPTPPVVMPVDTTSFTLSYATTIGKIPAGSESARFSVAAALDTDKEQAKPGVVTVNKLPLPAHVKTIGNAAITQGETALPEVTLDGPAAGSEALHLQAMTAKTGLADVVDFNAVTLNYKDGSRAGQQDTVKLVGVGGKIFGGPLPDIAMPEGTTRFTVGFVSKTGVWPEGVQQLDFKLYVSLDADKVENSTPGTVTIDPLATLASFSIKPTGASAISAKVGESEAEASIPYEIKAVFNNVYDVASLSRRDPAVLRPALQERAAAGMKVVARVKGPSRPAQGKNWCAFTINDGDKHAAFPAYFSYVNKTGDDSRVTQDCASADIVLRDDANGVDKAGWVETRDSAKGVATYTLQTGLHFIMSQPNSGVEMETGDEWNGKAVGEGSVEAELTPQ